MITQKLGWIAILEAIGIIENNPEDNNILHSQFKIIEKYAKELKDQAKYNMSLNQDCCDGL